LVVVPLQGLAPAAARHPVAAHTGPRLPIVLAGDPVIQVHGLLGGEAFCAGQQEHVQAGHRVAGLAGLEQKIAAARAAEQAQSVRLPVRILAGGEMQPCRGDQAGREQGQHRQQTRAEPAAQPVQAAGRLAGVGLQQAPAQVKSAPEGEQRRQRQEADRAKSEIPPTDGEDDHAEHGDRQEEQREIKRHAEREAREEGRRPSSARRGEARAQPRRQVRRRHQRHRQRVPDVGNRIKKEFRAKTCRQFDRQRENRQHDRDDQQQPAALRQPCRFARKPRTLNRRGSRHGIHIALIS